MRKSFFLLLILFFSCTEENKNINYGEDICIFCKMTITDKRYACELINTNGKVFKFDAIECLIQYNKLIDFEVEKILVSDFNFPHNFLKVEKSFFLKSQNLRSPMGLNVATFQNIDEVKHAEKKIGGEILTWEKVISITDENFK